jgi:hypothetical protein
MEGKLINTWCFKYPGRCSERDLDQDRAYRCQLNLDKFLSQHREIREVSIPNLIGCGIGGGNAMRWHGEIGKVCAKHSVAIRWISEGKAVKVVKEAVKEPEVFTDAAEEPPQLVRNSRINDYRDYTLGNISGDGNCLPRAVAQVYFGDQAKWKQLTTGYVKQADDGAEYGESFIVWAAAQLRISLHVINGDVVHEYGVGPIFVIELSGFHYSNVCFKRNVTGSVCEILIMSKDDTVSQGVSRWRKDGGLDIGYLNGSQVLVYSDFESANRCVSYARYTLGSSEVVCDNSNALHMHTIQARAQFERVKVVF